MHLSLLSAVLLGLVQGVAEFLPISSSGHLAIAEHLLASRAIEVPGFYDVLLHLGTLVAVFIAYWQDIRDMILELIDGVRDLARGTTITAGCFVGFERKFAVRFSFLLSIPAILGANILSLKSALEGGIIWADVPVYLVGVAVAAGVGYLCIRLLRMIADKGRFGWFAYYCWAAGALTLVLALLGK